MQVEFVTIDKAELERLIESTVTRVLERVLTPTDQIMSKAEAAKYLNKSSSTITRMMKRGLPYNGTGRPLFKRSEIDKWTDPN